MRLVWYELRKNVFRRYLLVVLCTFLVFNGLKIYSDFTHGDIVEIKAMAVNQQKAYSQIYEKLKGTLTVEKVKWFADEVSELESITADGTYDKGEKEERYTHYIFGDLYLLRHFFYPHISYCISYRSNMNEMLKEAVENIDFYNQYGNSYEADKNTYLLSHYQDRSITSFYNMEAWDSLIQYQFSDFLILLIIILGLSGLFAQEKENHMEDLIYSSRFGFFDMTWAKIGAIVLFIIVTVLLFSFENFALFQLLCNLTGSTSPIYSIITFQNTPVSCNVLTFYLGAVGGKILGFCVMGFLMNLFSRFCARGLVAFLINTLLSVLLLYLGGYAEAIEPLHQFFAILSPFTLINGQLLFHGLKGISVGGHYVHMGVSGLVIQLILGFFALLILRRFGSYKTDIRLSAVKIVWRSRHVTD